MIKSIRIKCPLCAEESELYLSINPAVIILKCPECWTPLMYTKTEIRILSEQELKRITAPSTQSVFHSIFDKAFKKNKIIDHFSEIKNSVRFSQKESGNGLLSMKPEVILSENHISSDDIIDLHYELAKCKDVQQFLEKA